MTEDRFDMAVVGAGMVGASLALAAAQSGWRVAVIEPAAPAEPAANSEPDLRVSALSTGSEQWLRELGVWHTMTAYPMAPFSALSVWEAPAGPLRRLPGGPGIARRASTSFEAARLGRSHLGHIVENVITRYALWQHLQDHDYIQCLCPATLAQLDQHPEAALLTLDSGDTVTCGLVVGADGANSVTRKLAGIGTSRSQYRQQAMVINVRHKPPQGSMTWQMFTPDGPRAYLPLPDIGGNSWASLVWYDHPEKLDELMGLEEPALIRSVRDAFPVELPELLAAPARGRFPIAREHAYRYASARVVLIGDAAHSINPLAGQGVNLGFQDAACLAQLLREAADNGSEPGQKALLERYETLRRPRNRLMMDVMDLFYTLFSNRQPPLHLLRTLGLGLAGSLPVARDQVARYAMGIDETLPAAVESWLKRLA